MKNTKSEWTRHSESLFTHCIEAVLKKIQLCEHPSTIRVELDTDVFESPRLGGLTYSVDTYKHTQTYNFGIDISDPQIARIRVYQEDMCKEYVGAYLELKSPRDIINSPYIVKSIVAFLMEHIVWK